MYLDSVQGSVLGGVARANLLNSLQSGNSKENLDFAFQLDMGPPAFSLTVEGSTDDLRAYQARLGNNHYLFFSGIRSQSAGMLVWNGYLGGRFEGGRDPINAYFRDQANRIVDQLAFTESAGRLNLFMCGYSAGGALFPYVMRALKARNIEFDSNYGISFGAPKAGGSAVQRDQPYRLQRWMLSGDPIPLVPPRATQMQRWFAGLSTWQYERLNAFQQGEGGVSIDVAGNTTASVFPTAASLDPVGSVSAFIANQDVLQSELHSLPAYSSRLRLVQLNDNSVVSRQPAVSGGDFGGEFPRREIEKAERATLGVIAHIAERQNAQPVRIPTQQLFKAVRQGKIWRVLFGNVIITTTNRRRAARGFARVGNDLLRRLQRQAVVNVDDLQTQFAAYLVAASDPLSNFVPKLNTVIA